MSDKTVGSEEKSILDRLETQYIYGISPLKEEADQQDESSEEEVILEAVPEDEDNLMKKNNSSAMVD